MRKTRQFDEAVELIQRDNDEWPDDDDEFYRIIYASVWVICGMPDDADWLDIQLGHELDKPGSI
jgi:hypothetical protein